MASYETMAFLSSLQDEEDLDDDGFDEHHQHPHPHNLSRLSVCTSSTFGVDDDDDDDDDVDNLVSLMSIENFDADGELSDGKELPAARLSSDSENELGSCYSLPSTPPRRRNRVKDYASDNGGHGTKKSDPPPRRRRRRTMRRSDRWRVDFDRAEKEHLVHGFSGESDQSGVMLITRPKGGNRALCMDLEEVKACRDLGFELEHHRMLEIPSRLSFSNSPLDTSSGSNSPIANWRISAPGDDPRDVKARLKVWAQAVALASASKYGT
ncbi:hypothetical protein E2542_SST11490 [Spatholobus suberectus]|nr:hypothetical protein E2542_SST11490 [Spatholobus suberectus]